MRLTQATPRRYPHLILSILTFLCLHILNKESFADCPKLTYPPRFGGVAPAIVNVEEAQKWREYRALREQERRREARYPQEIRARYRVELEQILEGCVSISELVDLGRNLFLRRFSREEGYGHGIASLPLKSRFQRTHFGGPDASACVDCHWKGGFAGAGDRVDNSYAFGDGERLSSSDMRNPPALWGVGWVEAIATEMSEELQVLKREAIRIAKEEGREVRVNLSTKGVDFGSITVRVDLTIDTREIEGLDEDLIIKPFGWRGVFPTLREFVEVSAHKHLGMQSEHLVSAAYRELELGQSDHRSLSHLVDPALIQANALFLDPDQDGVTRELTEGQILAMVSFLATLDTPLVEIPTRGVYQVPPRVGSLEFIDTPAFVDRWQRGALLFNEVGCASCHRPYLPLKSSRLSIPIYNTSSSTPSVQSLDLDLAEVAAKPHPERSKNYNEKTGSDRGGSDKDELWLVPVFSDFKRHKMGEHLRAQHQERGVAHDEYLTRRLWGLKKTSPYLHHGGALTIEEAIRAHGGEGSEALNAVEAFMELNPDERSSLRLFLMSLSRGPAIRIR